MMKKLFKVDVENTFYVMAEDKVEAEDVARENLFNETHNHLISSDEVVPSWDYIDSEWQDDIPYESDDNKTCGEIFREMKEAEELRKIRAEADKKQLKFPFYEKVLK